MNICKIVQSLLKSLENEEEIWYHMYSFIMVEVFSHGVFLARKEKLNVKGSNGKDNGSRRESKAHYCPGTE